MNNQWDHFLKILLSKNKITTIDFYFAQWIMKNYPHCQESSIPILAALVSYASTTLNYICLPLSLINTRENLFKFLEIDQEENPEFTLQQIPIMWNTNIDYESLVITQHAQIDDVNSLKHPLILENCNLYLQRDWIYEQQIANHLIKRIQRPPCSDFSQINPQHYVDEQKLKLNNEQLKAIQCCLHNPLQIITGGPGTGKTTIVSAILAILLKNKESLKIALCTPTGKAQARMQESIREEIEKLIIPPSIKTLIQQVKISTIHRLLGFIPDSINFKHNSQNPLPYDLIIIDEASMIQQSLMAKLLNAIPLNTQLIIIGDQNQLSSVESGAILLNICEALTPLEQNSENCEFRQIANSAKSNNDDFPIISRLQTSQRFKAGGSIDRFKKYLENTHVDDTVAESAWQILNNPQDTQLVQYPLPKKENIQDFLTQRIITSPNINELSGWIKDGIPYTQMKSLEEAWNMFDSFRILCTINHGPYGTKAINQLIQKILHLGHDNHSLPNGLPLIITQNDYVNNLFNGDVGMVWRAKNKTPQVYFPKDNGWYPVNISQLSQYELAFALTIHKSQGSGFNRVLTLLLEHELPILTKELIYTAVTRAKKQSEIATNEDILKFSIQNQSIRQSGLSKILQKNISFC